MSFIAPAWLILLALLPVVVVLHARARRRTIVAPGLMLWKRMQVATGRTAAARRWPRPDLLMILQLLAVLLAVLALARPLWGPGRDIDHLIVVLDTSASMQTHSGPGSNFDAARERIAALAARGNETALVSLVTSGVAARPVIARQPFRPEILREALAMVRATDGQTDDAGLATLLAALRRDGETTRIINVSHAPLPDAGGSDTHASAAAPDPTRTLSILHLGPDGQPLIDALRSMDGITIHTADALPDDLLPFDLVVVDTTTVSRRPEIATLWIGAAGLDGDDFSPMTAGRPDDRADAHPLIDGIDWSTLVYDSATTLSPPAGAVTVLAAHGRPLLTAHTAPSGPDAGTEVRLAFDPRHANWAEGPAIALFAANLMDWLGLRPGGPGASSCKVGAECVVPRHFSGGTITRVDGDDTAETRVLAATRFTPERAGLFRLDRAGRSALLAVTRPTGSAAAAVPNALSNTDFDPAAIMPVEITPALAGALLAVLLVEGALFLRRQGAAGGLEKRLPWLRLAAVVLVLLALLDPPLPFPMGREATAAILDPSTGTAPAGLPAGAIQIVNSPVPRMAADPAPPADGGFRGDTATALQLAAAALPQHGARRIMMSPPPDHEADTIAPVVAALARRGITFGLLPRAEAADAFSILSVDAPAPAYAGDTLTLTARIQAPAPAEATLVISRGGETIARHAVALHADVNRIDIPVTVEGAGDTFFGVSLFMPGDPQAGSKDGTWMPVRPPGRIAVISPQTGRREAFTRMLDGQGFDAMAMDPRGAPADLAGWLAYDGIVLMNVPATAMTISRLASLEEAVRDHGRGLFLLGGPDSFGPGGYLETPLERLSPLSSRIPRDARDTAIVFVIDRSGSMLQTVGGKTRIDIAREAVMAAAGLMEERDRMGVVTFSADARTAFPLQPLTDPADVARALAGVRAGGGTAIHPGLTVAHDMLRGSPAAVRHVVVMTDGMSELADFQSLLAAMRADGITVSTIAIGSTAETSIAEDIARLGGGAFHASGDFEALPAIMSQETLLSATSPVVEVATTPQRVAADDAFLAGVPDSLPDIDGFVRTSAKPGARLSWIVRDGSGEPAPWLASWRHGLGQVLAVAGDAMGPWSRRLAAADDYPRLWSQAMRQFLPAVDLLAVSLSGPGLTIRRAGDRIDVRIAQDRPSDTPPILTMTDAAGHRRVLPLARGGESAGSAGVWRASFFPEEAGDIMLSVSDDGREAATRLHVAGPSRASPSAGTVDIPAILHLASGPHDDAPWRTIRARWAFLASALALFMLALAHRHLSPLRRPSGLRRHGPPQSPRAQSPRG